MASAEVGAEVGAEVLHVHSVDGTKRRLEELEDLFDVLRVAEALAEVARVHQRTLVYIAAADGQTDDNKHRHAHKLRW